MTDFHNVILTPENSLDDKFILLCRSVLAKRARTVIDHILKHGIITNEDLNTTYGYDHPPRAIRDVRENGIPLITHKLNSLKTGRKIGAYTFDDISRIKKGRIGGRKSFSKKFKDLLIDKYSSRDAFTNEKLDSRYLQIDHRIPYEINGETSELDLHSYMLLDSSSQRSKSWSCENCINFIQLHDPNTCKSCFWATPENYNHIAIKQTRRVEIIWSGLEVSEFETLDFASKQDGVTIQELIKNRLKK